MTDPTPDPIAAVRSMLLEDPLITTQVDDRVFGGELRASVTPLMPTKAVVVSYSGGPNAIGTAFQDYGDVRIDVRCYGPTPHEADELRRGVYPIFKQLRRQVHDECLLHWARHSGGPLPLRDPDTDWPYLFDSWQLLVAEVAAT